MSRSVDLNVIRSDAIKEVDATLARLSRYERSNHLLSDMRWYDCMSLVDIHAVWEKYAERRLVAALNNNPQHFLIENLIRGITRIPAGLAEHLVRSGSKYFDFRSCSDLIRKANQLVSNDYNPFTGIAKVHRDHLDALSAIRNVIVHKSDAAWDSYRRVLKDAFTINAAPQPGEFLDSIDRRANSPLRGAKRIRVFAHVVQYVVKET